MVGVTSKKKIGARMLSKRGTTHETSPVSKKFKKKSKILLKTLLLSPVFHNVSKVFIGICVGSALTYGSFIWVGKTFANEVVISKSEIISRVGKLTTLPQEEPVKIVRVQDAEDLKKQNEFYNNVEEGDYILMYETLAVIYNLRNNTIVGIKELPKKENPPSP